jgi:hypothetical protein
MPETRHEAAIDRMARKLRSIYPNDLADDFYFQRQAEALFDAALGEDRANALDAHAHHGDDIADLWRGELLGRTALGGEAEGEKLRSAANELIEAYDDWSVNSYPADNGSRNAAEAWHAESHRVNRAVEILRLALSQHPEPRTSLLDEPACKPYPEPRQAEGEWLDGKLLRLEGIIATAPIGYKRMAIQFIADLRAALSEPRQDQPVNRAPLESWASDE